MTTPSAPREYHTRQVHNLFKSVTYSDAGIAVGGTVKFNNGLPIGACHINTFVKVKVAFNAATTNVLTVGTNPNTTNDIVAAADVNEASAIGFNVAGVGVLSTTAALDVYVKFDQTGTVASAGSADIVVTYVMPE